MFEKLKDDGSFEDFCLQCLKMRSRSECSYKEYQIERIDYNAYIFKYKHETVITAYSVIELINAIRIHERMVNIDAEI